MLVSGNYFDVLGVKPALGRFFEGDEQRDIFDAHAGRRAEPRHVEERASTPIRRSSAARSR